MLVTELIYLLISRHDLLRLGSLHYLWHSILLRNFVVLDISGELYFRLLRHILL